MTANTGRRWSLGLTLGVTLGAFGYLFAADRGIDYPEAERQMRLRYGEAGLNRLRQWQEGQRPAAAKPALAATSTTGASSPVPVGATPASPSPAGSTSPNAASASTATTTAPPASATPAGAVPASTTVASPTLPATTPAQSTMPAATSSTAPPTATPSSAAAAHISSTPASTVATPVTVLASADPQRARLEQANRLINGLLLYNDDMSIWEQVDYWATPLETLGRGTGDCEDYALAKYFSLTLMGVPQERLRMVYVRADIGTRELPQQVAHMVLAYYEHPRAEPLILDNLIDEIRPAGQRPDLAPVYSFNHDGVWLGADAAKPPAGSAARLSRWRDLLARMNGEGFHFD